jgi:hypothetical protein
MRLLLINKVIWAAAAVLILFSAGSDGVSADANNLTGSSKNEPKTDVNDTNGPTIKLSYNTPMSAKNPAFAFMYFVPLIAPTLVDMEISPDNQQQSWCTEYDKKVTEKTFFVSYEFEMRGKGYFNNILDTQEIIATFKEEIKKGEPVKNALDYIKFEGEGIGRIEARGTIDGNTVTVTRVDVHFNAKGEKSPITIGLYSVDHQDGKYKYENRYHEMVARVATLTFKKCDGEPTMGVKVASVIKAAKRDGFMGKVRGMVANLFIEPPGISKLGNDTMLNFGLALFNEQPSFTFPKAPNIKSKPTDNSSKK